MSEDQSTATERFRLEDRGGEFVLVSTADFHESVLSATDVFLLDRLFHPIASQLRQSDRRIGSGAQPRRPVSAKEFVLNADYLMGMVLVDVADFQGLTATYGIAPPQARDLAQSLVRWAERVERASEKTTEQ